MYKKTDSLIGALLQYTGLVFCFFIFPFFIFNTSLASLLELRLENHRHHVFQQLSDYLKILLPYSDERRYYHLMLQKTFDLAKQQPDPIAYLEKAILHLKRLHPKRFEFIVWNQKGDIVEKLADEKRFRFVIKRLYEVLRSVSQHLLANESEEIQSLPIVKENLNLIRHFLGRVFLPNSLALPYLDGDDASLILADYGQERPYFWYHSNDQVSLLCFISWAAINDNHGLKSIVRASNRANPGRLIGFASLHELDQPFICQHSQISNEVVMALARYENSSEQAIETEHAQIVVQMLNPHIRIFALQLKENPLYNPDKMRLQIITRILSVYLLIGMLLYFNFRVRRAFFSIRWKLLLLFLYANIAPLAVLGAIAYDYLENRKVALRNEIQLESARLLRDLDNRFLLQSHAFKKRLNQIVEEINLTSERETLSNSQIEQLKKTIDNFRPSEAFLIDRDGKINFAFGRSDKSIKHSISYVKNIANAMLQYHNRLIVKADKSDVLTKIADPQESDFVRNSIRDSRKIWPMSVGDMMKMGYWNMFGDKSRYRNTHFLLLLWDEEDFQQIFLETSFSQMPRNGLMAGVFARTFESQQIYPEPTEINHELTTFLKSARQSGGNIYGNLTLAGKTHLVTGWRGKNMNRTCFAVVCPTERIDQEIARIRRHILGAAAISIILTIIIAMAVARQFISPIRQLAAAATAISRNEYRYRMQTGDKDEFGHLAIVMNRMIEGLGELEIAKIVQESLLPEQQPEFAPFDIYGESVVMTTLAGDYYDFIEVDTNRLGVMIGDVAGHGISAALIMAMAKAGVKMATPDEISDGTRFVKELHQIIYRLKTSRQKRMMTFQYLLLDRNKAQVTLTNAGHCYPLLIDKTEQQAHYIEATGLPLGVGRAPSYHEITLSLQPGQALLLYTDGVAEARNKAGQELGYDRFSDLALRCYDEHAASYYARLYREYLDWSEGESGDDITIIVICYSKGKSADEQ